MLNGVERNTARICCIQATCKNSKVNIKHSIMASVIISKSKCHSTFLEQQIRTTLSCIEMFIFKNIC